MPLTTLNLKALVDQKIITYLNTSPSYEVLRQHCINPIVIEEVAHLLNDELQGICIVDKGQQKLRIQKAMCDKQLSDDLAEEANDKRQAAKDEENKEHLYKELNTLDNPLSGYRDEQRELKVKHENLSNQLIRLKADESLHAAHGHPSEQTQTESNSKYKVKKSHLKRELGAVKDTLDRTTKNIEVLMNRKAEVKTKIDIILPGQEKSREERSKARAHRAKMRSPHDASFEQLSNLNRLQMQNDIVQGEKSLDAMLLQKKQEAYSLVYPQYLLLLKENIKVMALSPDSTEILEQIIPFMENYLTRINLAKQDTSVLRGLEFEKRSLQNRLAEKRADCERLSNTTPQLSQQSARLESENCDLTLQVQEREVLNKKVLAAAWTSSSLTVPLAGVPFLATTAVSLSFFIPAAITGIVAVGLFGTGIVNRLQNNWDREKQEANHATIANNKQQMETDYGQFERIVIVEIPHLQERLTNQETQILKCQENIHQHETEAAFSLRKAREVSLPQYPKSNSFFEDPPPAYEAVPSAPKPEGEVELATTNSI